MAVANDYLNPTIIGKYGPMKKRWNNSKQKYENVYINPPSPKKQKSIIKKKLSKIRKNNAYNAKLSKKIKKDLARLTKLFAAIKKAKKAKHRRAR